MSLENNLLEVLAGAAAVTAIAGSNLRQEWRDQNDTGPAVTITGISNSPEYALDVSNAFYRARVQLDCFGDTFEQTSDLADAVRGALHGYSGTADGLAIDSVTFENSTTLGEQIGDRKIRRLSLDFFVKYNEV